MALGAVSHVWSGEINNYNVNAMSRCTVIRTNRAIPPAIKE